MVTPAKLAVIPKISGSCNGVQNWTSSQEAAARMGIAQRGNPGMVFPRHNSTALSRHSVQGAKKRTWIDRIARGLRFRMVKNAHQAATLTTMKPAVHRILVLNAGRRLPGFGGISPLISPRSRRHRTFLGVSAGCAPWADPGHPRTVFARDQQVHGD